MGCDPPPSGGTHSFTAAEADPQPPPRAPGTAVPGHSPAMPPLFQFLHAAKPPGPSFAQSDERLRTGRRPFSGGGGGSSVPTGAQTHPLPASGLSVSAEEHGTLKVLLLRALPPKESQPKIMKFLLQAWGRAFPWAGEGLGLVLSRFPCHPPRRLTPLLLICKFCPLALALGLFYMAAKILNTQIWPP